MTDQGMERLSGMLRQWAQRPTLLSPPAARARVLGRLPTRQRHPVWRLAVAGGALAATGLALMLIVGRESEPIAGPPPALADTQQMIVHELRSGTKLYIVMRPNVAGGES